MRWFLFALLCALALLQLLIAVLNHFYFRTYALDYAIYNFAFYDFAHLRVSPVPAYIYPFPSTVLQDHFSLTLPILSPLYWLLNPLFGTYSLLIIQWCFILIGALGTYKFLLRKTQNPYLPHLAAIYYFLMFGRYSANLNDVNLAIIGASLVPLLFYYFDTEKKWQALTVFLLLLLNREDYALWLFFIAVFFLVVYRKSKGQRTIAIYLAIASVLYFLVVMKLIIPALETAERKYNLFDFSAVGNTPAEAFSFIILHPLKALALLFENQNGEAWHDGRKLEFYQVYLLSGAALLFLRPIFFLPFLPVLLRKMYDDNPLRWSIEGYYSIEFVSLLPLLVFWILSDFKKQSLQNTLAAALMLLTSLVTVWKISSLPHNAIVGQSNKYNFFSPEFYKPDLDMQQINYALSLIPKNEAVCATGRLLPHLAYREKVYYFPRHQNANYVLVLKKNDYWPLFANEFEAEITALRSSSDWQIKIEQEHILLFVRKSVQKP